jgi:hypothetical protein
MGFHVSRDLRWPNGIVYYDFHENIPNELRALFEKAMKLWMYFVNDENTYIQFIRRTQDDHQPYSFISDGQGATSAGAIGKPREGAAMVNFKWSVKDAHLIGTIPHELGHVLGLAHEHERNKSINNQPYVVAEGARMIPQNNITIAQAKLSRGKYEDIGAYDVNSIMHYPERVPGWGWNTADVAAVNAARRLLNYPSREDVENNYWRASQGDIEAVRHLYAKNPMPEKPKPQDDEE